MSFFKFFPHVTYDFTTKGDASPIVEDIVNISTKIEFLISDTDKATLCERYFIQGNELPEHISQAKYNTPDFAWTIMAINGLASISNNWPMSDLELVKFAKAKYGQTNLYNVHHYEKMPEGIIMDESFIISQYGAGALNTVTNLDYETRLNDFKRIIWIVRPGNINDFVGKYTSQITKLS